MEIYYRWNKLMIDWNENSSKIFLVNLFFFFFFEKWIKWIMECMTTTSFSVQVMKFQDNLLG